jgi:hypothetical protein
MISTESSLAISKEILENLMIKKNAYLLIRNYECWQVELLCHVFLYRFDH